MRKILILSLALSFALIGCGQQDELIEPFAEPAVETLPTVEEVIINGEENLEAEEVTEEPTVQLSESIEITAPSADAAVTSPFTVTGTALTELENVNIRIKNTKGDTLIQETARVTADSSFTITLHYQFSHSKEGFLEVYSDEGNLVSVPLQFK